VFVQPWVRQVVTPVWSQHAATCFTSSFNDWPQSATSSLLYQPSLGIFAQVKSHPLCCFVFLSIADGVCFKCLHLEVMWLLCPGVRLGLLGFASIYCRKPASTLGLAFWVWAGTIWPTGVGPGWVSLGLPGLHGTSTPVACKTCKMTRKPLADVNKTTWKRKALCVPYVCAKGETIGRN